MTITIGPMGTIFGSPDGVVVVGNRGEPIATFAICDDCGEAYLDPPYYSFDMECVVTETDPVTGIEEMIDHTCTNNLCPDCAGPYLEPENEDDPRKPTAQAQ